MVELWQERVWASPLAKDFTDKFGGKFGIHPSGSPLFYCIKTQESSKSFAMPNSETECMALISQSINENKNLLVDLPRFRPMS